MHASETGQDSSRGHSGIGGFVGIYLYIRGIILVTASTLVHRFEKRHEVDKELLLVSYGSSRVWRENFCDGCWFAAGEPFFVECAKGVLERRGISETWPGERGGVAIARQ